MTRPLKKFSAEQVSCTLWENEAKIGDRIVPMLKATVRESLAAIEAGLATEAITRKCPGG